MRGLGEHPEEAILFVGTLFSSPEVFNSALAILKNRFGEGILMASPVLPWDYSGYYTSELELPIFRTFVFFERFIDPVFLVDAKLFTHETEIRLSRENRRTINIDPGYLTLAKVVLASKKNYSHRINLGKGVFAELELFYKESRFNPMPYTYNDYRDESFISIFSKARTILKKKISLTKQLYIKCTDTAELSAAEPPESSG